MTATGTPVHTNMGLRHPALYNLLASMASASDQSALAEGVPPLLLELIKIRVSQLNGCAYCLRIHTADSLAKGESPERLSVLPVWRETAYFDGQERAALALAEYVTNIDRSHANTADYGAASEYLTSGQVSAVSWVALAINSFNRVAISGAYRVAPPREG